MEKIRVDTCPTLDEKLLDTQKISRHLPTIPPPSHIREFGSPIVRLSLGKERYIMPLPLLVASPYDSVKGLQSTIYWEKFEMIMLNLLWRKFYNQSLTPFVFCIH